MRTSTPVAEFVSRGSVPYKIFSASAPSGRSWDTSRGVHELQPKSSCTRTNTRAPAANGSAEVIPTKVNGLVPEFRVASTGSKSLSWSTCCSCSCSCPCSLAPGASGRKSMEVSNSKSASSEACSADCDSVTISGFTPARSKRCSIKGGAACGVAEVLVVVGSARRGAV